MSSTLTTVRRSRVPAVAAALCTVAAGLTLGLPSAHAMPDGQWTFDEPGHTSWIVPAGVTAVDLEMWGAAGGGSSPGSRGGAGAHAAVLLEVVPGQTVEVYVGGTGDDVSTADGAAHAGGYNGGGDGGAKGVNGSGGGGGGATDVRIGGTALSDRVAVAAGGGGSAGSAGGDALAEDGDDAGDYSGILGGGGATTEEGGAGAAGSGVNAGLGAGEDGELGVGGAGQYDSHCRYTGGGGGGGLFGGGGGGCINNNGGSGGGAGSSLLTEEGFVDDLVVDNPDEDEDGYAVITLMTSDAPAAPNAVAGDGSATVSWTAPEFTGSMEITGYTVTAYPGFAQCSTEGALSCEVTGLTNGTAYTFSVVATTDVGDSDPSDQSGPVTPQVGTVAPSVVFPSRGGFLSTWAVIRSFGDPVSTLTVSTPKVCRASGPRVVFLRTAGTCRVAVTQDGTAVARGTIPVAAAGKGTPLTTKQIRFRGGSTFLTRGSKLRLADWAPALLNDGTVVVVTGWVSGMRTNAAARTLSAKRAQVVATYLRSLGVHVTARYGPGAHWLGSSARSRATDVSWYAAPVLR